MMLLSPAAAMAEPVVPTYTVTTYATAANAAGIAFDGWGPMNLSIGRYPDNPGTVLWAPPGGGVAVPLTVIQIPNPSAVVFDAFGRFTGYRNSVLVAGSVGAGSGRISAIRFDATVSTVVENPLLNNAGQMAVANGGHDLYISAGGNGSVVRYTDAHLLTTFIPSNPSTPGVTNDSLGLGYGTPFSRLVLGRSDGTVAVYRTDPAGTLVDAAYAWSVPTPVVVASPIGLDSIWDDDIFVFTGTGDLRRYTAPGIFTTIGTGFGPIVDAEFGPDGALYASSNVSGKVYRVWCMDASLSGGWNGGASLFGCPGSSASLTVSAPASGPVTYRWQRTAAPGEPGAVDGWVDITDGPVWIAGQQVGTLTGQGTPTITLAASSIAGNEAALTQWHLFTRCTAANACGSRTLSKVLTVYSADIGVQGGVYGHDGVLDNNDFVVFIDLFFAGDARANVGSAGGEPGNDGAFDNNDFVVFIDRFFTHC